MESKSLYINTSLGSTEALHMEFKKVTISLPKNLYEEGMSLINRGLFSNFSDLVRSGIREEFKGLKPILTDFDEKYIYSDKKLIAAVKKSTKQLKAGKGKTLKTDKEMDEYFKNL
jgi:hypothetical protein